MLYVDVCETEEQAGKDSAETNAPPLCNKHTVAFTSQERKQKRVTFTYCRQRRVETCCTK